MNEDVEITLLQDDVIVTEPLVADYILPTATSSTLGGVKIGDNIQIDSGGHISVPKASASTLGLIRIGTGLAIDSNGIVTATGEYELPQATKTTLGGVYLDDELDSESVNPVQNSTLTTVLDGLSTSLTTLSGTVDGLSDDVTDATTAVTGLSSTVSTLSSTVATNTANISTNTGNISSLTNSVGTINETLTLHGNDLSTLSGQLTSLMQDITYTYTYEDIDDTVWTAGEIDIRGKGFYAVMYINLEGSLTIASGSSVTLFTLPLEATPAYDAYSGADIVDGSISVTVDSTNGNINLINNNNSSVNVGKLNASIPIIYGSI
jgi:hypothetical protein